MKTRKILGLTIIAIALNLAVGCSYVESGVKGCQSDTVYIQRRATVYDHSGEIIRQWEGKMRAGDLGTYIDIKTDSGLKRVMLQGTVVIEEL